MSFVIRRFSVNGFRKFRTPLVVDGLTNGLNIIIEPNETGKSTVLDALRAAFFVRYNASTQLVKSYVPHGEAIGPEVSADFELNHVAWSLRKQFLKSKAIELTGPQGRTQGEEAEVQLNTLLGSVRDTSRNGDTATHGALGLLWVAQTEALAVSAPGQIVRDSITSMLEAEVGAIMGGESYQKVRKRIDTQYDLYWTPTGQKRGRQTEALAHAEATQAAAQKAEERLTQLEHSFTALETTRTQLKVLQREMADTTDSQTRKDLLAELETARAAAQILTTRKAEQDTLHARLSTLEDLQQRHTAAVTAQTNANARLAETRARHALVAEARATANQKAQTARSTCEQARTARQAAQTALRMGEELTRHNQRRAAIQAACTRHDTLIDLERALHTAQTQARTAIPAAQLAVLEGLERAVAEAQAIAKAGETRITLSGTTTDITIDGAPAQPGELTLTHPTRVRLGQAEILISPPATATHAQTELTAARTKRQQALDDLGVADSATARARNEAAHDASTTLRMLAVQITAATPADERISLAAGPEALKLFVRELDATWNSTPDTQPDITALTTARDEAETAYARAEGTLASALEALRRADDDALPLASAEAAATSDVKHATQTVESIEARPEWPELTETLHRLRHDVTQAAVTLEQATRNAATHDTAAITRRIEAIEARAKSAAEARTRLETDMARLEGIIETEGGQGLAERAATAREEAQTAQIKLNQVTAEADMLKLLRDTLETARNETSAKFVGPVARRMQPYIGRLLPGCDLGFSEDLALEKITRAGSDEVCTSLSRGTQEQLALLTRIAFADMLQEQGKPVSLILDDPLVYSDDTRLDLMTDIITEAATRMQVILLTCRDRAFRHVAGNRIILGQSSPQTA